MRVSVIVPVRDDPRIDGLLASLALQSNAPEFEVIVALDGGARTPTVSPGGPPTRIVRLPARGPYAARNAAAREARGGVLLFTDSDCVCPPDWVAHAARAFEDPAMAAAVLQGTSDPFARTRVSLWVQDEYERWVAGHAAASYRRMCNTRCFGMNRDAFAARPFPDAHLRGGDGAFGLDLEARGVEVRWDPSWRVLHRNPESRLVVARQLFRQGLDGVRWGRGNGAGADLFGPPKDPSSPGARLHRRAAAYPAFAATASAAAACASAVLGLATVALPYSAGRPVFRRFARAAHFAGRLRGEAEKPRSPRSEEPGSRRTSGEAMREVSGPPDVTVVLETETHGSGHRLGFVESLAGIAEQTRRDRILEVLVVSSAPPDEEQTRAIAGSGLPLVWIERPGVRYYDLKNVGIEVSRGRWVVLSDSDTRMAPGYLAAALDAFASADASVAALTGRTRYLPGPFARELAVAQLPNQAAEPGDTTHFLAHNVVFRGETLRANLFRAGHIRLFPDADLADRLLAQGLRILYRPDLGVTHNYARHWSELGRHCVVIGYHAARHGSLDGRRIVSAPRDAIGRFRVLSRRLARLRPALPIPPARVPLSLAFFAFYAAAVGVGYSAFRRGRPEPFADF